MAQSYVYITLDTTAPTNPIVRIEGDALYTSNQLVTLNISVDDTITTGYQMKIWGSVDPSNDTNIQTTEELSEWISFSENPQVMLSGLDGTKTINIRVRDDVHNPSSVAVDTIEMDGSIPTVTVTTPDIPKISKVEGKDTTSFTFQSSENFVEYKVKLVGTTGAKEDAGQLIGVVNGSINTSGTGTFPSSTITTVTLKAKDLESAMANMNGQNIIKVFVKDEAGLWSA
jgi:hypothetical protein